MIDVRCMRARWRVHDAVDDDVVNGGAGSGQAETEVIRANQAKQLDDLIRILPRLQYGLDVNVRFNR
jgi:hypothetical protein